MSAGSEARPLLLGVGQGRGWLLGIGAGVWWSSIRFFLPCEHVHKHLSSLGSAARKLLKVTAGCSVHWDQLWGLMQWSQSFRTYFHTGVRKNQKLLAQPLDWNIPTYTFTCNRCLSSKQALASAKVWSMGNNPALSAQVLAFGKTVAENF